VDALIVMEKSEVLRPGFLDLLRPGGTVLLAATRILPAGLPLEMYPSDEQIHACLRPYRVVEVDAMGAAFELGDRSGRIANVVMLGALSVLAPFNLFPAQFWLQALKNANAKPAVWAANYAAFNTGREITASELLAA
jgi:indolepyruvate ferredoxin oxidoreductase alpha subunit